MAESQIVRGHPWVWRDAVVRPPEGLEAGELVEIEGPTHGVVAQGIWDPQSPIAVRVHLLAASPRLSDVTIVEHIALAVARRRSLVDLEVTSAYRLCNGEGDRVPGLVLDRYADVAIARLDGAGIAARFPGFAEQLFGILEREGIRSLAVRGIEDPSPRDPGQGKIRPVLGAPPPDVIDVRENSMIMRVDLAHGQKTGAFLDQRDNRSRVRAIASGRSVLNLFSYAGGFSIAAALGGASQVTSVDLAQSAHLTAQYSFRANGLDPTRHEFVTADAFTFLDDARQRNRTWDLVVSDPPSFAPSAKALPRALSAYRRLHRACAQVLSPGGLFCAASCSSHVDADTFVSTLDDASIGRSDLSVVSVLGQPADHPVVAGWPEGRYLKFVILC